MLESNADIIGLQEVSSISKDYYIFRRKLADWFDTLEGENGLTAAGYTCVKGKNLYTGDDYSYDLTLNKDKTMFNPIYFKTEKYNLIANDTIWFTDKDSRYEASRIDGADTWKGLNYVVLEDKETGVQFMYVNLHLIVRGKETKNDDGTVEKKGNWLKDADGNYTDHHVQELQVIYLREILDDLQKQYDIPMFIGGDFNNSASKINTWFTKSTVNSDGSINAGGKPTESVSVVRSNPYATNIITSCSSTTEDFANLGDYNVTGDKWGAIDLWFVSNFEGVMHCYIVDDNKVASTGKYPSDHLPTKFVVTIYSETN